MRLADFITANVEPILAEWEAFARSIWPGPATDPATLRDHAEQMLHAAVADMKADQSDEQQSDKSRGKAGDGPHVDRVNRVSAQHGVGRVGSGFNLATVIAEFRALRASVIRLWRESHPPADPNDLNDITRFNESIDQSLTEAVVAYSHHVGQERAAAFGQQMRHGDELRELNNKLLVSSVRQHELTERAERAAAAMRAAKEEAEAANRTKDEFVAVVSHELRTPLSAILLWGKLLQGGAVGGDDAPDAVDTIVRSAEAQKGLIEDLLDVSRMLSGNLRIDVREADLREVIGEATATVRPMADAKGVHVETTFDAGVGPVRVDPDRIRQVVWNLLNNAVKFTDGGGRVQVALRRLETHIEIRVTDSGRGIAPAFLPHVFDRFRQQDGSTTRQAGGLGLGLAIARQLVELHGGTVRADSAGEGNGATFAVTLPLPLPHLRPRQPTGESGRAGKAGTRGDSFNSARALAGVRVLLVEDDPNMRSAVQLLLRNGGAEVAGVGSAREALAAFNQSVSTGRPYDVLASDLGMPEMDGYELIREVRRVEREQGLTRGIPAVALSAYAREEDRAKSGVAGFQMHVAKPVEPDELVATVASLAARAK